jgi:membrane fusion protein, macrolide-specific efflux system
MTPRATRPWLNYLLGVACAGAILAAFLVVGPASGSQATVTRTAKAAQGVVQSTVSGSGNLQAASQLNLGFKTSGTVTNIYVTQGQHVTSGQLLATLDPQSAEVTLEQARASLQSAIANLAQEEENDGETSTGQSSGSSDDAETTTKMGSSSSRSSTASKPTESTATREANIASARANVSSDKLTVQSDEEAVQNTKLYAPEDGTIVSLSGQVGETASGGGTTKASSSSSSSSGGSSSGTAATGGAAAGSRTGATGASSSSGTSGSSSSSDSSSTSFAVLSDLSSMQLVVALSESEIGNVKHGQTATVTVEALDGAKLAAHVSEVALLSTSTSGVVSYDVTFQLDQLESGLKVGMSATAEVVVKQAEGVNVPTSAISADSVTVERGGKQVRQRVVTGLAGNSSTIVLSGLKAGETVVLPAASSNSSTTSLTSRLAGRTGAGGLGGGGGGGGFAGGGGGGGGGAAFFRGGG